MYKISDGKSVCKNTTDDFKKSQLFLSSDNGESIKPLKNWGKGEDANISLYHVYNLYKSVKIYCHLYVYLYYSS